MHLDIEFITHATLKIRGEFGALLCDPWFMNEPIFNLSAWKFPAAVLPPEEVVKDVDYLYITHAHEDHFHIPSINYISRDVQVLLPAYEFHPSLRAQTMEITLRKMGFYNIRKIKSWDSVLLGGMTPFTVIPSAKSRDHDWENSGFVLEHSDCTMLNMNDNINDKELCFEIKKRWSEIDIAFVQAGGVTMFPGCFKMSEAHMREEAAKRKVAFLDQRRTLDYIQPKYIVPFAGDFCWLDDKYFHNNWANRTTAKLFQEMVEKDYAHQNVQYLLMYPTDRWNIKDGLTRHHPGVDWDNMLDEIAKLKQRFQPKIDATNNWLKSANLNDLEARSRRHTNRVEQQITRDYIDFTARFRIAIESENAPFNFVIKASPEKGFAIDWNDKGQVDQTLHVPDYIWASVVEGRLLWNIMQWVSKAEQHNGFHKDMGRFFFWLEFHVDLNNRNIQAIIFPELYPEMDQYLDPGRGVFPIEGEYGLPGDEAL